MENNQTAVEWFIDWLMDNPITSDGYIEAMIKAKAMEKEQIKDAYAHGVVNEISIYNTITGEEFYNETYGI